MVASRLSDSRWSDVQRQFIAALEAAGATQAQHAVPIDRASPIPARELQALVDSGLVREASSNGYYLYARQSMPTAVESLVMNAYGFRGPFTPARLTKLVVFWLIMILIPIILLQLTGKS